MHRGPCRTLHLASLGSVGSCDSRSSAGVADRHKGPRGGFRDTWKVMMRRTLTVGLVLALLMGLGAAPVAAAPAAGNGGKTVIPVAFTAPIGCGAETIQLDGDGWVQVNAGSGQHVEFSRFHIDYTYSNDAGDTYTFRERGLGHLYFDGGTLFVTVSGRSFSTPFGAGGLAGQFTLNLFTGDLTTTGNDLGVIDAAACAALT